MDDRIATLSRIPEMCGRDGCGSFAMRGTIEVQYPDPIADSVGQLELSPASHATVKFWCACGHETTRIVPFK
jgi:hypothetical protein